MLESRAIRNLVEDDVKECFGKVFPPVGDGFALLDARSADFQFTLDHVPSADVSFVVWSYDGVHAQPLATAAGTTLQGEALPLLDSNPAESATSPSSAQLPATGRPVRIVGTTIVLSRETHKEEDDPVLMRFIDWSHVFAQLGFVLDSARTIGNAPEPPDS